MINTKNDREKNKIQNNFAKFYVNQILLEANF